MATVTVRKLDENWDPYYGNGQESFISDLDAVAQIIATRIKLLQGEWFESLASGTPLFQSMLGVGGSGRQPRAMALILTQRILGAPYVTGVANVQTGYDPQTRAFRFACRVSTQFGSLMISNQPGSLATITP